MPPNRFRSPAVLVYALLFSPVLILLHACTDQRKETSDNSEARPVPAKSEDRAAPSGPADSNAALTLPSDLQAALDSLTAANALQVRDRLRRDPQEWANRLSFFYREWGKLDPEAALAAASSEGKVSLAATLGVIEGWTTRDPRVARDWVAQQPSDALRTRYAAPLIKAWPTGDLDALAAWSRSHPSLLPQVAVKWSSSSPREAARWLGEISTGPHHRRATETLFRQWARVDPGAAGDYLIALREFPARDAALAAYATTVVADDPAAAAQWAEEISDPGLRRQILEALPSIRPLLDSAPGSLSGTP